jgi:hypothetical protein
MLTSFAWGGLPFETLPPAFAVTVHCVPRSSNGCAFDRTGLCRLPHIDDPITPVPIHPTLVAAGMVSRNVIVHLLVYSASGVIRSATA